MIVIFDVADASFQFYNEKEWIETLDVWTQELAEDGIETDDMYEIVDLIFGEEAYVEHVPEGYQHVFFSMDMDDFQFYRDYQLKDAINEIIWQTGESLEELLEEYEDLAAIVQDVTNGDLYYEAI